jgi:hypothetical protein
MSPDPSLSYRKKRDTEDRAAGATSRKSNIAPHNVMRYTGA